MLWNVVYDFFVMYIFGGFASDENLYEGFLGIFIHSSEVNQDVTSLSTVTAYIKAPFVSEDYLNTMTTYMTLGNYFSLIATIISMVVILFLCCALIKKIYNICAHIIG